MKQISSARSGRNSTDRKNIYPKTAQIARGTIAEWDREFGIYEDPE